MSVETSSANIGDHNVFERHEYKPSDHQLIKVIVEEYGNDLLWSDKIPSINSTQHLKCANNLSSQDAVLDCSHISSILAEVVHKHRFQINQDCALLVNITNDGSTAIKKYLIVQSEDSVKSAAMCESLSVSHCMVVFYNEVMVCILLGNTI